MASQLVRLAAMLVLGMAAGSLPAAAQSPRTGDSPPPSSLYLEWLSGWSGSVPGGDHIRIALDPETGTWGPAPVDQALQTAGITPPPIVRHHPNGMIEVIVDPSVVDYVFCRIGPDGQPVIGHGTAGTTTPELSGAPDR